MFLRLFLQERQQFHLEQIKAAEFRARTAAQQQLAKEQQQQQQQQMNPQMASTMVLHPGSVVPQPLQQQQVMPQPQHPMPPGGVVMQPQMQQQIPLHMVPQQQQ